MREFHGWFALAESAEQTDTGFFGARSAVALRAAARSVLVVGPDGRWARHAAETRPWAMAVVPPQASDAASGRAGPGPEEGEVLRMLASSETGEDMACRLGVSTYTIGRKASEFVRRLGTCRPFQTGVRVSGTGWLDPRPETCAHVLQAVDPVGAARG
ncbi:DNA-binding NarL/FixJ family response regulator [Catenulispora sp. EB89]